MIDFDEDNAKAFQELWYIFWFLIGPLCFSSYIYPTQTWCKINDIYKMHRPELKSFIISFLQPQLLCQQFFHECIILNPGHQHIFSLLQLWSRGRGTGRAVLKMQSLHKKLPIWTLPTWSARESDLQVKSANSGSKVPKTTIIWNLTYWKNDNREPEKRNPKSHKDLQHYKIENLRMIEHMWTETFKRELTACERKRLYDMAWRLLNNLLPRYLLCFWHIYCSILEF